MARLFFALWPDARCAPALAQLLPEIAEISGGKAVPSGKIHLTLSFLGEVRDERMAAAIGAADEVRARPFDLALDRLGSFRRARVAWVGMSEVPAALIDLQRQLAGELRARGFELEERDFNPHLTIARKAACAVSESAVPPIAWRVDAFTLVRSDTATGRYVVERSWGLGT